MAGTRRRRNAKGRFMKGGGAAPRRRRRRRHAVARARTAAPARRRRRRRAVASYASNPPRRRRRRRVGLRARARRRYRRNPFPGGSLVNSAVQGIKDGGAVVAGQIVARKFRGAVTGMMPAEMRGKVASGAGYVALNVLGAIATTMAAKKLLGGRAATFIAAGAWAEAINGAIAQTPIAPYLSAFPVRRVVRPGSESGRPVVGHAAYPQARIGARSGFAAYPGRVPVMQVNG